MYRAYVILGCTASGKGTVARLLAARLGAQIVSVDSMKVYRRMDIGTAKPPPDARRAVPHHVIDVVEPSEGYSVAQFLADAEAALAEIASAGQVALAAGGTSLYLKALAEGLFEGVTADPAVRRALQDRAREEGSLALHAELAAVDPVAAARIHPNDQRRIVRALEVHRVTGEPISRRQKQWDAPARRNDCVRIGLRREKDDQNRRINLRAKKMFQAGLIDEVAALLAEPAGLSEFAAQAVGYAEVIEHLAGRYTAEEALEQVKIHTRQLAKKQRTWQRRWPDVRWFDLACDEDPQQTVERILREIDFRPAGEAERL